MVVLDQVPELLAGHRRVQRHLQVGERVPEAVRQLHQRQSHGRQRVRLQPVLGRLPRGQNGDVAPVDVFQGHGVGHGRICIGVWFRVGGGGGVGNERRW